MLAVLYGLLCYASCAVLHFNFLSHLQMVPAYRTRTGKRPFGFTHAYVYNGIIPIRTCLRIRLTHGWDMPPCLESSCCENTAQSTGSCGGRPAAKHIICRSPSSANCLVLYIVTDAHTYTHTYIRMCGNRVIREKRRAQRARGRTEQNSKKHSTGEGRKQERGARSVAEKISNNARLILFALTAGTMSATISVTNGRQQIKRGASSSFPFLPAGRLEYPQQVPRMVPETGILHVSII